MQSRLSPCPLASGFRINIHTHRLYTGILTTNQSFDTVRYHVPLCLSRVFHPLSPNSFTTRDQLSETENGEPTNSSWLTLTFQFSFLLGTGVRVVVQTRIENSDAFANSKTKRFPCPNCTSAFGQKPSLTRHLRYECRQEPRFQCPYCQQRSKKTSDIYAHIRRKHANLKVFVIDIHGSIAHSSFNSFKIDRL